METALTVPMFVAQLAIILVAAKLGGEVAERFLRVPAVIGELSVGILIGPFALGGIDLPYVGPLFYFSPAGADHAIAVPIAEVLQSTAEVGAIVLLFMAGLETDLRQFLRYSGPASLVALGGVVAPFALGAGATVLFGYADGFGDIEALFMGAVCTATSIGITVRVLGDLRRLDTPEGVTTLAAAVLDDVLGIIVLTIVVGIGASGTSGDLSLQSTSLVVVRTLGFWIVLTVAGVLLSRHISNLIGRFNVSGASVALALALAFGAAVLADVAGLAMIIGAFSIGLALSGTDLARRLETPLSGVYAFLVPIFFVVTGMMVDVNELGSVWRFGLVLTLLATLGKVFGAGLPSLAVDFNRRGAMRIGFGMLPRGEVALIMASIGITEGLIGNSLFGVTIMMTLVTTIVAPIVLSQLFKDEKPGTRSGEMAGEVSAGEPADG